MPSPLLCSVVKKYIVCNMYYNNDSVIHIFYAYNNYRGFPVPCMHFFMMKIRCLAQGETAVLVYH